MLFKTRECDLSMKSVGQKESVRGKLQYYQELINQIEEEKRKEEELDEDIEDIEKKENR